MEPPEPEPTIDDVPQYLRDEHKEIVEQQVADLDDEETREAFGDWLFNEGAQDHIWAALAVNHAIVRQFIKSETAAKLINRRTDERLINLVLKHRKEPRA
jgi:hypothetical protein